MQNVLRCLQYFSTYFQLYPVSHWQSLVWNSLTCKISDSQSLPDCKFTIFSSYYNSNVTLSLIFILHMIHYEYHGKTSFIQFIHATVYVIIYRPWCCMLKIGWKFTIYFTEFNLNLLIVHYNAYQNYIGFTQSPHINFPIISTSNQNMARCRTQGKAVHIMAMSNKFLWIKRTKHLTGLQNPSTSLNNILVSHK